MEACSFRMTVTLAVLLGLATLPAQAQTPQDDYAMTAECAAIESAGTTIPNHTAEETRKVAVEFRQRAPTLGQQLGRTPDQVDSDITRHRNGILARLHGPDANEDQHQQADLTSMTQKCPTWLVFKALHDAGAGH